MGLIVVHSMTEQTTPRPWVRMPIEDPRVCGVFVGPNSKADADLTCIQVNAFLALVSALTYALSRLDPFYHPAELFEQCRAALALAKGESQ